MLTGAGISTDSGIPDFRGPNGVWTKNPAAERAATLSALPGRPGGAAAGVADPAALTGVGRQPNAGHRALVELERQGRLHAVVTQNIDELHQRAGHDPALVIEVHGTMRALQCWGCGDTRAMQAMLDRVRAGEDDPALPRCGGIVKSATISFGQALVPEVIDRAMQAAERCRPPARRGVHPAGVPGRQRRAPGQGRRRPRGHRQRRADGHGPLRRRRPASGRSARCSPRCSGLSGIPTRR